MGDRDPNQSAPLKKAASPSTLHPALQLVIGLCALSLTAAALTFAVVTAREQRNAALVRIGIDVLRADPDKESQVTAARQWALDLIDANSGGVKFGPAARQHLILHRLDYSQPIAYGDHLPIKELADPAAQPPKKLIEPCVGPVEIPKGPLDAGPTARLWAADRIALSECKTSNALLVEFYAKRDAGLAGKDVGQ